MPGVLHQVSKSPARLNEGINSRRNSGLWYQCRKQKWYESINEEKKRHQTYVKREKEIKHETTTSDSNSISNSLRIQMYSGQKKYDVYSIGNFAKDTNNTVHYLLSTLCCAVLGCSGVPNSLQPHGLQPARLLCPWGFSGKNTRVGCHAILRGIFPTQGPNPGLPHCRQILYWLSHQGNPV